MSEQELQQPFRRLPAYTSWLLRLALTSIALVYLTTHPTAAAANAYASLICLSLFSVASAFFVYALIRPRRKAIGPVIGVAFDSIAVSSGIYFGGVSGSALYVVYFLSTFTSGYRYGVTPLLVGSGLNALGFSYIITQQAHWHDNPMLALGLLVILVVLPLYFAWLVQKLGNMSRPGFESHLAHPWDTPQTRLAAPLCGITYIANQLLRSPLNQEQRSRARTVSAAAASLIPMLQRCSAPRLTSQTMEREDFALHLLVRDTVGLMNASQPANSSKRVGYEIDTSVPFRLNGDAFELQQVLIELTNELLMSSAGSQHIDIVVELTDPAPDETQICLTFDIAAVYDSVRSGSQNTAPVLDTVKPCHTPSLESEARFVTDVAPELVERLGGQLLPNMDCKGHTAYRVQLSFDHAGPCSETAKGRKLRKSRAMMIGGELSGQAEVIQLLLGWGVEVTQRDSIASALADLIQSATRALDYHFLVVDSRGSNADTSAFARAVGQEPTLSSIPMILLVPQRISAQRKTDALRAGYASILEAPLNKTLLFNALHSKNHVRTQPQNGVVRLIDHYVATNRFTAPLEVLISVSNMPEQIKLKALLEQAGHRAYTAENGTQALAALDNHHFDLAFLDLFLPECDGLETLRRYREASSESNPHPIPLVLLIEQDTNDAKKRCIEQGAYDVLIKPVRKYELLAVVSRIASNTEGESRPYRRSLESAITSRWLSGGVVLDQQTLNDLELLGSGIGFISDLVANFLRDGERLLDRMNTAQQLAQAHVFRDIAYALKGSAGSVGAKALFQLASKACNLRGNLFEQSAAALVTDLNAAFQAARASLLAYIEERRSQNTH